MMKSYQKSMKLKLKLKTNKIKLNALPAYDDRYIRK